MFDQIAHYTIGYLMARSLRKWTTPEDAVERVMAWAEMREELQHPGRCGDGCERDLRYWRKGAEKGAK